MSAKPRKRAPAKPRPKPDAAAQAIALASLALDKTAWANDLLAAFMPDCFANLKALADGVKVRQAIGGKTVVFDRPPDLQANIYLINRFLGMPRQAVEHTGKDGGAIPIMIVLPDNGRDPHAPAELDPPKALPLDPG